MISKKSFDLTTFDVSEVVKFISSQTGIKRQEGCLVLYPFSKVKVTPSLFKCYVTKDDITLVLSEGTVEYQKLLPANYVDEEEKYQVIVFRVPFTQSLKSKGAEVHVCFS
mgnify:CR=1 FL=1